MTHRLTLIFAAGVAAFIVVFLGALATYVALHGQRGMAAFATGDTSTVTTSIQAPSSQPAPNNLGTQSGTAQRDTQTSSSYPISTDNAVSIALSSAQGASLLQQPRLVNFSGTVAYEVQLDRGYVYVDAKNGHVLYNGANATNTQPQQRPRRWGR